MSAPTRTVDDIDDDLAHTRAEQWRADKHLTDIETQRQQLDDQELAAVTTIAGCRKRYDHLLDERLRLTDGQS
jgi:hypothetical protein